MKALKFLPVAAAVLFALAPQFAAAESSVVTTATGNASAKLNFRVTIPRVLFLQVGTGTPLTADATVDRVTFTPTVDEIVNATADLAGAGGDLTGGAVTVRVFANSGDVALSAAGGAGMVSGTDTIPWTQLKVVEAAGTAASGFLATSIAHPTIGTGSVTLTPASGVIRQAGKWTFQYRNGNFYKPGQYDGQVTYTATAP